MSNLIMSVDVEAAPSGNRTARKKMFRRRTRTMIRKCLSLLNTLGRIDAKEEMRGATLGYNPVMVKTLGNATIRNSFKRVEDRLKQCLQMKIGDE